MSETMSRVLCPVCAKWRKSKLRRKGDHWFCEDCFPKFKIPDDLIAEVDGVPVEMFGSEMTLPKSRRKK